MDLYKNLFKNRNTYNERLNMTVFVVNIFLIIMGMFMEGNASSIILIPLLAPIAKEYGINQVKVSREEGKVLTKLRQYM